MGDIMKITVLVENISEKENIISQHGLSLYIETENHKILFDMGQSDLFEQNARKLDIDLSDVDIAIISHGHYDHGGGLERFLEINNKAPVYISKYAFRPHYNGEKYIGLDITLKANNRLVFTDDVFEIDNGLVLQHCNSNTKKFKLGSFGLDMIENETVLPDDFRHEQYLEIKENGKTVLISGCSHKGILNIASWFDADVIIGGFHFSKLPLDETLEQYAKYLNDFDTDFYTCHCTGTDQFDFMKKHMNRLFYLSSGQRIEIQKEV